MKKAATAYKRASTDKTGIIDPLKLKIINLVMISLKD